MAERTGRYAWTTTLWVIVLIGAINWGLIGLFNWNLVDAIFGGGSREQTSAVSRVIYTLVGLSGVALAFLLPARFRAEHPRAGRRVEA